MLSRIVGGRVYIFPRRLKERLLDLFPKCRKPEFQKIIHTTDISGKQQTVFSLHPGHFGEHTLWIVEWTKWQPPRSIYSRGTRQFGEVMASPQPRCISPAVPALSPRAC